MYQNKKLFASSSSKQVELVPQNFDLSGCTVSPYLRENKNLLRQLVQQIFPGPIQQVGQDDGVNGEPTASGSEEETLTARGGYSCPIASAEAAQLYAECC